MNEFWIVLGVFLLILASISKFLFRKVSNPIGWKYLLPNYLRKGDNLGIFSVLQLLGMVWVSYGIFRVLWKAGLDLIPDPVLLFAELFLPLGIVFLLVRIIAK